VVETVVITTVGIIMTKMGPIAMTMERIMAILAIVVVEGLKVIARKGVSIVQWGETGTKNGQTAAGFPSDTGIPSTWPTEIVIGAIGPSATWGMQWLLQLLYAGTVILV
jgi:hypothetical protein